MGSDFCLTADKLGSSIAANIGILTLASIDDNRARFRASCEDSGARAATSNALRRTIALANRVQKG